MEYDQNAKDLGTKVDASVPIHLYDRMIRMSLSLSRQKDDLFPQSRPPFMQAVLNRGHHSGGLAANLRGTVEEAQAD